jgi:hypothetical protein
VRTARRVLIAFGGLGMAYALVGGLTDPDLKGGAFLFLTGVLVAHDAVLLPLTIGAGALVGRFVPLPSRALVRSALLVSLAVTVVALPLMFGPGRPAPASFATYGLVWAVTGSIILTRRVREARRRRADRRPRAPHSDPPPGPRSERPPTPGPAPRSPGPGTPPR